MNSSTSGRTTSKGSSVAAGLPALGYLEHALETSQWLRARSRVDDAGDLLGRAIAAFGVELAKVDPVTAAMLECDAELARLELVRLAAQRADVALVKAKRLPEDSPLDDVRGRDGSR